MSASIHFTGSKPVANGSPLTPHYNFITQVISVSGTQLLGPSEDLSGPEYIRGAQPALMATYGIALCW